MTDKKDMNDTIRAMLASDPWKLRVVGRQTMLKTINDLIENAATESERLLLEECLLVEKKIIEAAENKDQAAWDSLNAESEALAEKIKVVRALTK